MLLGQALAVVCQDLNDPALRNPAVRTRLDHSFQFGAEGNKPDDLVFYRRKMRPGDNVRSVAGLFWQTGKGQKLPDRISVEAQLASMAYERQTLHVRGSIGASVTLGPRRERKQADTLIVANGGHLDAAKLRDFPDHHIVWHWICCCSSSD